VPMAVTYVQNALHYIHDYTSELWHLSLTFVNLQVQNPCLKNC
jgi:hypothetical protein